MSNPFFQSLKETYTMNTKQKTIKTETFTAVVTNPGTRGFGFKVTKGTATRRQVRRAMKRSVQLEAKARLQHSLAESKAFTKKLASKKTVK
jgi:hypothetical protein